MSLCVRVCAVGRLEPRKDNTQRRSFDAAVVLVFLFFLFFIALLLCPFAVAKKQKRSSAR